ncbi:MAG: pyridoxamine 5'-phosphate oxidase [Pseudomonadota bacterium]
MDERPLEEGDKAGFDRDDGPAAASLGQDDPFALAQAWLEEARATEPNDPNAIALATADADGLPNVRMVLLKEIEPAGAHPDDPRGGFVFYTNYASAKGGELAANAQAAFVMHWKSLQRQLRVRGPVARVSAETSDAYFTSRPLHSRVGAAASPQSQPISGRRELLAKAAAVAARHPLGPPRPEHWGGFRITPTEIEFWSDGAFRLHDRVRWRWTGAGWDKARLAP